VATKKTDNSYFNEKVNLRLLSLPRKKIVTILDCYAGTGKLWKAVKKKTKKKLKILSIDKNPKQPGTLSGNNIKYLLSFDLTKFDIIDLDAYGIPFEQLKIIFKKEYFGIVHVTIIQVMFGGMPLSLFPELGYTKEMYKKCPAIFNQDGIKKCLDFLAINDVKSIRYHWQGRKFYGYFKTGKE